MRITERATVAVFGVLLACIFGVLLALVFLVTAVTVGTESADPTQKNTLSSIQGQPTHDLGWDRVETIRIREDRPVPITIPWAHFMLADEHH
jgi:hypothetical protein